MSTRIAVVTGAGSGLGRAISHALSADGWTVVLAGRRAGALRDTAAASGGTAVAVPADVSDPGSVRALFDEVGRRFGRIDLLVNNAGTTGAAVSLEDLPLSTWQSCVDTNLTGSFLCAQAAFRMMRDQRPRGGRIINNGSISAHSPRPHSIAYTATKHAITGLTKSLSLDGRPHGIACGQIDIGNAATDMTSGMSGGVPQADGSVRPEPTMDARHVAGAVVHMANLPLDANIQFLTVMATTMPFIGRG
ncbi:SDR family oxidoreductase [Amycolatopsis endophytica]|uniref:NAD(P)-dependent dehydrogenase (Short-subunit alcohol dehydrogenase family) n=1 Tax=Amycolatopsis endophytica TaxID=860233 RepID=A0A853B6S4_9PSEU|nr:SDR family oxidoreductase [Amycolatopsis endophytica]NYI90690.1 NAD(P)-dependent dehydrogenase (short-subunit alcohol dehydrogenase family) [Amycolatopsis endophytica]